MRSSRIAAILLCFCMYFAISGCSAGAGSNSSVDGKVKLVFWAHQEDAFVAAYEKQIEAYQNEHPNVEIKFQTFPYEIYNQKLKASFSARTPPDIAEMFGTWVPEYSRHGALAELPDGETLSKEYYPAPVGGYMLNGKLYGLPMEYNIENGGMLIHPQMLKEKGIDRPPATWDELVDAAKKLTVRDGKGIKVKGFDFVSTDNITFFVSFAHFAAEGPFLGRKRAREFPDPRSGQSDGGA
ncbi:extracellular solute-binding protein [Paenibacillus sp. JTLBN-2024]